MSTRVEAKTRTGPWTLDSTLYMFCIEKCEGMGRGRWGIGGCSR